LFDKDIAYKKFEKIRKEVLVPTPIEFLCKYHNANIYIKRDDKIITSSTLTELLKIIFSGKVKKLKNHLDKGRSR